jgi:hypothetical protein
VIPTVKAWILECIVLLTVGGSSFEALAAEKEPAVTHAFLACGADTYIRSGEGKITWRYPHSTRDGWVLEQGNVLLAVSKNKDYPGGAVVEVDKDGKVVFEFKGTQD